MAEAEENVVPKGLPFPGRRPALHPDDLDPEKFFPVGDRPLQPASILEPQSIAVTICVALDNYLFTGYEDGSVMEWCPKSSLMPLKSFKGHLGAITTLKVTESHVYTGATDCCARVFNRRSARVLRSFNNGHTAAVLDILAHDQAIFTAGGDDTILEWDAKKGRACSSLQGHSGPVNVLRLVGKHTLVSGSWDGSIRTWSVENFEQRRYATAPEFVHCRHFLRAHNDRLIDIFVFSPTLVVSFGCDGVLVRYLRWNSGTALHSATAIQHAEMLPDKCRMIGVSKDGELFLWDVIANTLLVSRKIAHSPLRFLGYLECDELLYVCGITVRGEVKTMDISQLSTTTSQGNRFISHALNDPIVSAIRVGSLFATMTCSECRLWKIEDFCFVRDSVTGKNSGISIEIDVLDV
mgnify:CR=1 FL=1